MITAEEKVAKLVALSKKTNYHESIAARTKAAELIVKYNLSVGQYPELRRFLPEDYGAELEVEDTVKCDSRTGLPKNGEKAEVKTKLVAKRDSSYFRQLVLAIALQWGVTVEFVPKAFNREYVVLKGYNDYIIQVIIEVEDSLKEINELVELYKRSHDESMYTQVAKDNLELCVAAGWIKGTWEARDIVLKRIGHYQDVKEESGQLPIIKDFHWPEDVDCSESWAMAYMEGKYNYFEYSDGSGTTLK